jgi:hypothetical protein
MNAMIIGTDTDNYDRQRIICSSFPSLYGTTPEEIRRIRIRRSNFSNIMAAILWDMIPSEYISSRGLSYNTASIQTRMTDEWGIGKGQLCNTQGTIWMRK